MTERSIRPYRRGDMLQISLRNDFAPLMKENPFGDGEPDMATSFSLVHDIWFPKACGGYIKERTGVYMLWGFCAPDLMRRDWLAVADKVRDMIAVLMASGAHRVHALASADNAAAVKFLMHLGLRNDLNRLVEYGPQGEDYVLLASLKGLYGQ